MEMTESSGVDMSYNGPPVPLYRQPVRLPTPKWQDEASCNTGNPALWELGSDDLDSQTQQELIAEGLKICSSCPVKSDCLSNSTELDRYWTTRGGRPPEGLFPDSVRPKYVSPLPVIRVNKGNYKGRKRAETCKRKHNNWRPRKGRPGERECASCREIWNGKRGKGDTMES